MVFLLCTTTACAITSVFTEIVLITVYQHNLCYNFCIYRPCAYYCVSAQTVSQLTFCAVSSESVSTLCCHQCKEIDCVLGLLYQTVNPQTMLLVTSHLTALSLLHQQAQHELLAVIYNILILFNHIPPINFFLPIIIKAFGNTRHFHGQGFHTTICYLCRGR